MILLQMSPETGIVAVLAAALVKALDFVAKKFNSDSRAEVLEVKIDNLEKTCRDGFNRVVNAVDKLNK